MQLVQVFERQTDQPLSVAVLIDTSGSTAKDLKYEVDSVTRFLRAVLRDGNPADAIGLYSFNWQVAKQNGNLIFSLTQRWYLDGKSAETVVQIFSQFSFG